MTSLDELTAELGKVTGALDEVEGKLAALSMLPAETEQEASKWRRYAAVAQTRLSYADVQLGMLRLELARIDGEGDMTLAVEIGWAQARMEALGKALEKATAWLHGG